MTVSLIHRASSPKGSPGKKTRKISAPSGPFNKQYVVLEYRYSFVPKPLLGFQYYLHIKPKAKQTTYIYSLV